MVFRLLLLSLLCLSQLGCGLAYVTKAATYQFSMLNSRVPNLEARASGQLTLQERQTLDVIEEVRGFGSKLGLNVGELYGTVALGWNHTIWNVSGSKPLAFESVTWWFPIVGTVPYLGFFEKDQALEQVKVLEAQELETYLRTAGAYSTLGYFEDPILPNMLYWSEWTVARVILHELTHATIWLPGSVNFNESVANFVGEVAGLKFLEAKYGIKSQTLARAKASLEDQRTWRILLQKLYQDLAEVYDHATWPDEVKREKKTELYASLPARVNSASFQYPKRYLALANQNWNNPRLMQFRTYNDNRKYFEALLSDNNGDVLEFMKAMNRIARRHSSPLEYLKQRYQ
jgi:predicted aminopeptidase